MSKFNNFPVPKKGKLRAVLKRPASMKTKAWKQVKYVRSPDAVPEVRMDRCKWKRSLAQILQSSPSTLVKMLREDGLLHKWEGHVCPRCCRGTLGGLQQLGGLLKHRCSAKKCHTYINPHHAHPIFVDHWGSSSTPLATQACLLMLLLNRVSHPTIHRLLHVNHKSIEDMEKRLGQLRERWVRNKEKDIKFGQGGKWQDVEADEATFDKKVVNGQLHWEQWCGIVQRGKPQTLVLHRLKPVISKLRAPGPGAIRKVEWQPLAVKWLQHRDIILHTDSAKSYAIKVKGVLHDRVIHKKKRVKVNGEWKWLTPKYVELHKHVLPGSKKAITVKKGTQIIDRCWRFLKDRLNINQNCKVGSSLLRIRLRSAQYEYWHRGHDLWLATGSLVQWFLLKA